MPAETVTAAVCNVFRCWVDQRLFNHRLDFAIRELARRSGAVRRVIDRSDAQRLEAIRAMFERCGFAPDEAEVRARILYYMQIGYYALELSEPLGIGWRVSATTCSASPGSPPRPGEVEEFVSHAREVAARW
jgi:hypothetical protein